MFIRTNRTPNSPRRSIQIVESIRTGKTVRQHIVRYVGVAHDEDEEQKLRAYAQELIVKIETERANEGALVSLSEEAVAHGLAKRRGRPPRKKLEDIPGVNEVVLGDLLEDKRVIEGPNDVLGTLYTYLGFDTILKNKRDNALLRDLVLARIMNPASKKATQAHMAEHWGKEYDIDAIYRLMDRVFERILDLKQAVFQATHSLTQGQIDVMLFDVTTLYFESQEADNLREFGYSKDQKYHCTQVVLALATNEDGLPIGYELFPGNTAEVGTLMACLEQWKSRFSIGKVTFVADRALCTRKNLAALESANFSFVVAMPMRRSLKAEKVEEVFAAERTEKIIGTDVLWTSELEFEGKRLIVTYSDRRARKDSADREKIIQKLTAKLGSAKNGKKLISNSGYLKYIEPTDGGPGTFSLSLEKIAEDAKWDGFHAVLTNDWEASPEDLLARYRRLWVIEESFRVQKHSLAVRPVYHYKQERIQAHIALCYLAFATIRHTQQRIKLAQKSMSVEVIRAALMSVQASILKNPKTGDTYRMPSAFNQTARTIYKAFNLERDLTPSVYLS